VRILETVSELQQLSDAERAAGRRIALVPTMGALHPGHLSLVKVARERADRVWVSIFVNPTQFNDPNDLSAYPRSLDADLEACELAGVDVVFRPDAGEMYPSDGQTTVEVGGLCEPLCGRARPGHFRGVTTIVSKLLLAAKPHVAVFGEKDYQQLAVIRRMVRDLGFGVEVVGAATLREADGLAMSSRNANLDPEARRQAVALVRALERWFARSMRPRPQPPRVRPIATSCWRWRGPRSRALRSRASTTPSCATRTRSLRLQAA